jgi:hypothetical protein
MVSLRPHVEIAARAAAAVIGGYALAGAFSIGLAAGLMAAKVTPADAVLSAGMLSFLVYVAAIIWAFAARSTWRAWSGIGAGIAASAGIALLAGFFH